MQHLRLRLHCHRSQLLSSFPLLPSTLLSTREEKERAWTRGWLNLPDGKGTSEARPSNTWVTRPNVLTSLANAFCWTRTLIVFMLFNLQDHVPSKRSGTGRLFVHKCNDLRTGTCVWFQQMGQRRGHRMVLRRLSALLQEIRNLWTWYVCSRESQRL